MKFYEILWDSLTTMSIQLTEQRDKLVEEIKQFVQDICDLNDQLTKKIMKFDIQSTNSCGY